MALAIVAHSDKSGLQVRPRRHFVRLRQISFTHLFVRRSRQLPHSRIGSLFCQFCELLSKRSAYRATDAMTHRAIIPARYPPIGAWPALMLADMAAAYLDFANTHELAQAIRRGEAPSPIAYRGIGRARQPVWSKAAIDHFTSPHSGLNRDGTVGEDLASLVRPRAVQH